MHSQWAVLAMSAVAILSTVAKPLAPPTTGWLYNFTYVSFIFPFTATQCEPFDIFYNSTKGDTFDFYDLTYYDLTYSHALFRIDVPKGTGYVEWICNIPAGLGFNAGQNFTVEPGSSSACLGNITTTYSHLSYDTTVFASFTQNPSPLVTPLSANDFYATTTFPIGAYSTITLNPNLAVTPTTTSPPSSSSPVTFSTSSPPSPTTPPPPTSPPSPSPTPSHKSRNAAVAGGVVGAVAFVLLILAIMLWRIRRSLGLPSSPINSQPATTGELGSTYLSPPFQSSGAELPGTAPAPCSHGNELKSDSGAMVVPVAGNLEPAVVPVALSPAGIESATGMPPATSSQQVYDHSTITTGGGPVGSGNVSVSNVFHIYNIHHPQPNSSSSLPHLPKILPTTAAAQVSG